MPLAAAHALLAKFLNDDDRRAAPHIKSERLSFDGRPFFGYDARITMRRARDQVARGHRATATSIGLASR